MSQPAEKSIALGIGLNFIWPGIGYIYLGRTGIGVLCIIFIPIFALFTLGWAVVFFWVASIIDFIMLKDKNKKEIEVATTKKCPECAELVKNEAKTCRFCKHQFEIKEPAKETLQPAIIAS
jgi:TM2 domain-containing membrane protein YozV